MPLPLPVGNPMDYVNCYVLVGSDGVTVVDPGWNHEDGWLALNSGLTNLGAAPADVTHVLVTHFHPDHYGLAPRLRAASRARVLMHADDARMIASSELQIDDILLSIAEFLLSCGAPDSEIAGLAEERGLLQRLRSTIGPDDHVSPGAVLTLGDQEVEAIWTPGHTPGHLSYYLPRDGLLMTGDHVLPRISPNVSVYDHSPSNPLGDFLGSLDLLRSWTVREVLPAHEYRFADLALRLDQLVAHHDARFREVLSLLRVHGTSTSWGLASSLEWSRPWEEMSRFTRRSANGEILAHLVELEGRGAVVRSHCTPQLWSNVTAVEDVSSR